MTMYQTPTTNRRASTGKFRKLLSAFFRSAYVAYTATPFANILIHDAAVANEYGDDLFPRSFIINLPAPSITFGPSLVFGRDDDAEDPAESRCRCFVRWIRTGKAGLHRRTRRILRRDTRARMSFRLPWKMRYSASFSPVQQERRAEDRTPTTPMLIHVSRFKDVHQKVYSQVNDWVGNLKRVLKYRTGHDDLQRRLQVLWENDFVPTTAAVRLRDMGRDVPETTWSQVEAHLAVAAEKIRAQVMNSDMRDAIDYDGNADTGLSIIAVGGDKLSRGLTLEGLTVSYFLRASKMYDSLMQMGRWFGYRPGYVDLCRLYMTPDLELWFRHIARAAEELRERLDHMAMLGSTPEQYGLRIQSHDILLVTAPNKMRHAREFRCLPGRGEDSDRLL